jgi:hypothetical protein
MKILARIIQMRNGEEMGSNRQIEAEIWHFGHLEYNSHTKECRRSIMHSK